MLKKKIIILMTLLFSIHVNARITFRWLGVSGFIISDDEITLVFDPAITRVGLVDYLPFRKIQSNHQEVDYWLEQCSLKKVSAIIVNHAHSDHVIDAPYLSKRFLSPIYGSESVLNVARGQDINEDKLHLIKHKMKWKIGQFEIESIETPHPPHAMNILLMDGVIAKPLKNPTSTWNYRVGKTYSFKLNHPEGRILFQATGKVGSPDPLEGSKNDVLLLTIANRNSSDELIDKRILPTESKTLIPLHYDNFFAPMRRDGVVEELWGLNSSEFKQQVSLRAPLVKTLWPKYCEEIVLF